MKKYSIIYADPPWRYERNGVQGAAEKHYPTMSVEELCNLPVSEIADDNSILFYGLLTQNFHKFFKLSMLGDLFTKVLLSFGLNKTKVVRDGFTVLVTGQEEIQKYVYLLQEDTLKGCLIVCISLLSVRCVGIVKNLMKQRIRFWNLWVIFHV